MTNLIDLIQFFNLTHGGDIVRLDGGTCTNSGVEIGGASGSLAIGEVHFIKG